MNRKAIGDKIFKETVQKHFPVPKHIILRLKKPAECSHSRNEDRIMAKYHEIKILEIKRKIVKASNGLEIREKLSFLTDTLEASGK